MGVENIEEWDVPVGRVVSSWDRALLKIKSYNDVPERFTAGTMFCAALKNERRFVSVRQAKPGSGGWILDIGLSTSAEAEAFKGAELLIHPSMRPPLPPGEFYLDDMLGMRVVTEAGEELGEVEEILETPFTTFIQHHWP
jgi:16S rRNA processing protein RimM